MDGRAREAREAITFDATPIGQIGFERVERSGNEERAIVVERERAFQDEVARRGGVKVVILLEAYGRWLATLRGLLDAYVGRRAEERHREGRIDEQVPFQLELQHPAGGRARKTKARQRKAPLGARGSAMLRDPRPQRVQLRRPCVGRWRTLLGRVGKSDARQRHDHQHDAEEPTAHDLLGEPTQGAPPLDLSANTSLTRT